MVGKALRLIVLMAGCAVLGSPWHVRAEFNISREYEIKVAYLFNFAKFVEWPKEAFADDSAPLVLGVLGEDPFGNLLDGIVEGEVLNNRKLVVKRIGKFDGKQDLADCHVLFISLSEEQSLNQIIETLKDASILSVSETKGFSRNGGIINFIQRKNKIRFEINVDAAKQAKLKVSSKLLYLAKIVKTSSQ